MAIFNQNNMLSDFAFEDMGGGGLFDSGSFTLQDLLNYSSTPEPSFVAPAPAPVYMPEPVYTPELVYTPPAFVSQPAIDYFAQQFAPEMFTQAPAPVYQPTFTPEPVAAPMLPPAVMESLFTGQPVGAVMPTPEFVYQPMPAYQPIQQVADAPVEQLQPAQPAEETKPSSASVIDNLTKQILGSSDSSKWTGGVGAEQAAKDMAKIMAGIGITDISQFGKITQTGFQEDVRPDGRGGYVDQRGNPVDPNIVQTGSYETEGGRIDYATAPIGTQVTYGNKETNQAVPITYSERQTGNAFGGTFEGKGNTGYRVDFDASGKPVFYTTGASSSDAASALPFIQMALLATGAGGLLGNALLGSGASQVAANALGGAILGGGTSAITGGDVVKGALLGGAGGALSGYLAPEVPVDAAGTPTVDPEAFMTPDVSIFEAPPTNTLFPPIEAPPIDVALPPITEAPVVTTPPYIEPESFMTPMPVEPTPVPTPTYVEPEAFMTPQAPIVTEAPVSVVDNIPELVITPTPEPVVTPDVVVAVNPPALTLADLGIDYSLNNGSLMKPLTDMGGAQGVQPGTSANLPDMGGGQGLTINVGAPSTTLADAIATLAGVNPAPLPDMGGAQGLTYQTPTGLVTEGGLLATGIAGTVPSILGETGINTATNIGSNIGTELAKINTGITEPTPLPPASTNPLSNLTPSQIANILKGAAGLFGAVNASKVAGGGSTAFNVGALPTQGIPLNSQDYFNAIQQNYNSLLPALPRDVATPLANWYNSQYGA